MRSAFRIQRFAPDTALEAGPFAVRAFMLTRREAGRRLATRLFGDVDALPNVLVRLFDEAVFRLLLMAPPRLAAFTPVRRDFALVDTRADFPRLLVLLFLAVVLAIASTPFPGDNRALCS